MNTLEVNVIHERKNIIPINQNLSTFKEDNINQYSLNNNYFDPTHNSPPNEFMLKLKQRMFIYNNSSNKN